MPDTSSKAKAVLIGRGVGCMAAAAFMIRDACIPSDAASSWDLFKSMPSLEKTGLAGLAETVAIHKHNRTFKISH